MKIGYIGLGKMGYGMVQRMLEKSHEVVAYNRSKEKIDLIAKEGATAAYTIEEVFKLLDEKSQSQNRLIWIMVPWATVDEILSQIMPFLKNGDTVIDGGNSPYKLSKERAERLAKIGVEFMDVGVSGGPGGARNGACLMIGGKEENYLKFKNLFNDLSVENGHQYLGSFGAGHFVKMIHNGIEYGMMQSIGEGFAILKKSDFNLDLSKVASLYNHGSVIESRLIGWLERAYMEHGAELEGISGEVKHSGEGLWTVETAESMGLRADNIKQSLDFRISSKDNPSYTGKVVSALRNQFGGHEVKE